MMYFCRALQMAMLGGYVDRLPFSFFSAVFYWFRSIRCIVVNNDINNALHKQQREIDELPRKIHRQQMNINNPLQHTHTDIL